MQKKRRKGKAAKEERSQRYQKQVMRSRTMPHRTGDGGLPRTFGSETTETNKKK